MDEIQATSGAAALRAALDLLLSCDLTAEHSTGLVGLLQSVETERRRLDVVGQQLLAEIAQRRLAGDYGRATAADLLVTTLRLTPREARDRVDHATVLGPRFGFSGEPLPELYPDLAAAQRVGTLSTAHVKVILNCLAQLEALPPVVGASVAPVAERLLVDAAHHEHPGELARTAAMVLARLDPDGVTPREDKVERQRDFTLVRRADGSSLARGTLTAGATAAWQSIFDSLAAPAPAEDGTPDPRSAGQRRHDALCDVAMRVLRDGSLPECGGVPVTILATTSLSELRSAGAVVVTGHGDQLSLAQLLRLAAEAEVIPVVFDDAGAVVGFGRGRRLASRGQRLALAARDGGCCFPGCDRPPAWTQVHHVRPWIRGGLTDLDNLCLLCGFHHREFERLGWQVVMHDGVPEWIPPPWIDSTQAPRRNALGRRREVTFAVVAARDDRRARAPA